MQPIQFTEFIRTASDHDDFRKMVHALDEELYRRNGDTQKQYDQYNQIDKIKHAIVVYTDGKPVGCGCFKRFDDNTAEIKRMFLLPEMRGRQLAAQLLQALEQWAVEEDLTKAILETGLRQVEAIRLYTRSGYLLTENYGQYIEMEDSICYRKELV